MTKIVVRPRSCESASRSASRRVAGELVQRPERLVHEEQVRVGHQRPGDRDTHPHAAGQVPGHRLGAAAEFDLLQGRSHARGGLRAGHARQIEGQAHVGGDTGPGHQRRLLEDEGEAASVPADPVEAAAPPQDPAVARLGETRDQLQERALPAAGGADQTDELPRWMVRETGSSPRTPPGKIFSAERISTTGGRLAACRESWTRASMAVTPAGC